MLTYADDIVLYCDAYTQRNSYKLHLIYWHMLQQTQVLCLLQQEQKFFVVNPETQLKINNQQIEWTDDHNYLGVIIDKQLRFHSTSNTLQTELSRLQTL